MTTVASPAPASAGSSPGSSAPVAGKGPGADIAVEPRLPLGALIALVVGSMIGGGIFGLPSQMAAAAAPGPLIIGWLITGVGMLALAFTFQALSRRRPEIEGGVYGYARAGFGDFVGFTSAWGYWISAWIGNIGYLVLLFATLGYFWPDVFAEGANVTSIIGASAVIWALHVLILAGVRQAAIVNTIVTVAKIVPILTFVALVAFAFDAGLFSADFWGETTLFDGETLGSSFDQIRNMMLITVWVFIGIEGASIYSARAKRRSDIGRATVIGFVGVLALLIAVNLLSFAAMSRPDIAALEDPSMAGVLEHVVGPWGAAFVSIGLIISLVGAILAWVLLAAEILRAPAMEGVLPRWVGRENGKGTPVGAVWLTTLSMQALLIVTLFNESSYTALIILASSLILLPYLWSALFQVVNTVRGRGFSPGEGRAGELAVGLVATIYAIWLVYAGGLGYLLVAALAYLLGLPLYVWGRREAGGRVFSRADLILGALIGVAGVAGVVGLAQGWVSV